MKLILKSTTNLWKAKLSTDVLSELTMALRIPDCAHMMVK